VHSLEFVDWIPILKGTTQRVQSVQRAAKHFHRDVLQRNIQPNVFDVDDARDTVIHVVDRYFIPGDHFYNAAIPVEPVPAYNYKEDKKNMWKTDRKNVQ